MTLSYDKPLRYSWNVPHQPKLQSSDMVAKLMKWMDRTFESQTETRMPDTNHNASTNIAIEMTAQIDKKPEVTFKVQLSKLAIFSELLYKESIPDGLAKYVVKSKTCLVNTRQVQFWAGRGYLQNHWRKWIQQLMPVRLWKRLNTPSVWLESLLWLFRRKMFESTHGLECLRPWQ